MTTESKRTPKAERTREHILTTALALFAARGYQETTLREIAAAADISLGLTYRYFDRKESLVLALYERLLAETEREAAALAEGPLARRVIETLRACLTRLTPHRDAMAALFGVGLSPDSDAAVLGDAVGPIRARAWQIYHAAVTGAKDAPRPAQADQLATVFYALHLAMILFWLQDRTPDQRSTAQLLEFLEDALAKLRPLLRLPPVSASLARLSEILLPMFGPGRAA